MNKKCFRLADSKLYLTQNSINLIIEEAVNRWFETHPDELKILDNPGAIQEVFQETDTPKLICI